MRAPYMAPIVEIVPELHHGGRMVQRLEEIDYSGDRWVGRFKAESSGTLLMFLNDAVLPLDFANCCGSLHPTAFNVRTRAANNRFEDCRAAGAARVWQGSGPTPLLPGTTPPLGN